MVTGKYSFNNGLQGGKMKFHKTKVDKFEKYKVNIEGKADHKRSVVIMRVRSSHIARPSLLVTAQWLALHSSSPHHPPWF